MPLKTTGDLLLLIPVPVLFCKFCDVICIKMYCRGIPAKKFIDSVYIKEIFNHVIFCPAREKLLDNFVLVLIWTM